MEWFPTQWYTIENYFLFLSLCLHCNVCNATAEGSAGLTRSFSDMWYSKLDPFIAALSEEQVEKLGQHSPILASWYTVWWSHCDCIAVGYVNEWNMNAKHCFVSQVVLSSVIRVVGADRLVAMKKLGQVMPGLLAYSERHHSRISKIRQAVIHNSMHWVNVLYSEWFALHSSPMPSDLLIGLRELSGEPAASAREER